MTVNCIIDDLMVLDMEPKLVGGGKKLEDAVRGRI